MINERLEEILEILSRYDNDADFIDYYQIFNFDKSASFEEISNLISKRNLLSLFNLQQVNFIPAEYREKYVQMIEVVNDAIDIFSNSRSKDTYDENLKQFSKNDNSNDNVSSKSDVVIEKPVVQEELKAKEIPVFSDEILELEKTIKLKTAVDEEALKSEKNIESREKDLDEINLEKAIIINSKKFGFDLTRDALVELIMKNSIIGFTRQEGVRDIILSINSDKLWKIISSSSIKDNTINTEQIVMNYLTDLVFRDPGLVNQVKCLEDACVVTLNKYDLRGYQGQTANALDKFCVSGDASSFTSTNNARENLANNVDFKNARFLIYCSVNQLRYENPDFAYEYAKSLDTKITKLYFDIILNKNKDNQYGNSSYGK